MVCPAPAPSAYWVRVEKIPAGAAESCAVSLTNCLINASYPGTPAAGEPSKWYPAGAQNTVCTVTLRITEPPW